MVAMEDPQRMMAVVAAMEHPSGEEEEVVAVVDLNCTSLVGAAGEEGLEAILNH